MWCVLVSGCVERLCSRYDGPVCGCVGDEMIGIGGGNVCCGSGACGGGIGFDVVLGNEFVDDRLELCCGESSKEVCLLEQCEVVRNGSLGVGALDDDMCSG